MRPTTSLITIAGPCAAETEEQVLLSINEAKRRNVDYVRVSLWKPRTKPGFDGMKEAGIPLLQQAVAMGVNPATEVLVPEQAQNILDAVLPMLGNRRIMLWVGSRNQNHYIQQEIARVASQDGRVTLMVKNQPWQCEQHWQGIVEHTLAGGIDPQNVILCHRGFMANGNNPLGLRNVPDSEMAMRIRNQNRMAMVLDLSHTAGTADKVALMAEEACRLPYDGVVVEVHPNPRFAWTDAKQQLTWEQLDQLMADLHVKSQPVEEVKRVCAV